MVLVRLDKKCREGKADCQGVVCRRVCFDFIRRTMQNNYHRTIQNALCEYNPSYLKLTVGNSTRGHGCSLVQLYCPLCRQHVFVKFCKEYFQLLHCGSVYFAMEGHLFWDFLFARFRIFSWIFVSLLFVFLLFYFWAPCFFASLLSLLLCFSAGLFCFSAFPAFVLLEPKQSLRFSLSLSLFFKYNIIPNQS